VRTDRDQLDRSWAELLAAFWAGDPDAFSRLLWESPIIADVCQRHQDLANRLRIRHQEDDALLEAKAVASADAFFKWDRLHDQVPSDPPDAGRRFFARVFANAIRSGLRRTTRQRGREREMPQDDEGHVMEPPAADEGPLVDLVQTELLEAVREGVDRVEEVGRRVVLKLMCLEASAVGGEEAEAYALSAAEADWQPDRKAHPKSRPAGEVEDALRAAKRKNPTFKPDAQWYATQFGIAKSNTYDQWCSRAIKDLRKMMGLAKRGKDAGVSDDQT
jgi:hypothetical protein